MKISYEIQISRKQEAWWVTVTISHLGCEWTSRPAKLNAESREAAVREADNVGHTLARVLAPESYQKLAAKGSAR